MDILVCVKQVPGSTNVQVDPVTGVLKRSGIPSKINPYDLYAIETALTLAERSQWHGGHHHHGPSPGKGRDRRGGVHGCKGRHGALRPEICGS